MYIHTYPELDVMETMYEHTPAYMRPSQLPLFVVGEDWLSPEHCDAIIDKCSELEGYQFPHCRATTREIPRPLHEVFKPMKDFAELMNETLWNYDLNSVGAWMQTYQGTELSNYQKHMDIVPGQSRKLSAVLMLSDPRDYQGGELRIYNWPSYQAINPSRGTIVVFPSWLTHEVTTVLVGHRQTINMGFFGPDWK